MNVTTRSPQCESLESRTFFAGTPLALRPIVDARHVAAAFVTFNKSYHDDLKTILFASGTSPGAQRAAFDQAVAGALTTLNTTIDADITDLPAQAALASTIQGQLTGSAASSLESELAALPTPTAPATSSARSFAAKSQVDIVKTGFNVAKEVVTSPTGTISPGTVLSDLGKIASAFVTFAKTFDTDTKSILFGSGTPSANRPAFDAAIATALGTLNTSIASAISNLPASVSSTLNTKIHDRLLNASNSGNSLQEKLASVSTPDDNFIEKLVFNVTTKIKMVSAGVDVTRYIGTAVHQFNFAS